jgi:hypothetical protein
LSFPPDSLAIQPRTRRINNKGEREMDMFGGLTRTSSRIAIAAAFGLTLGVYAMSTPAKAADYGVGGDCCADLEERVAELEATTVRKGNKKVSVTISGWVVKTMNWWDDGGGGNFAVGDKDADLASRFAITGSATIAPGWSAGYNMTITAPDDTFGILSNQFDDLQGVNNDINTLYSYIYVKSDNYGTLNWGTLSPASDNAAVLADISGTVIESNAVWFEGSGFFLRPSGGAGGLSPPLAERKRQCHRQPVCLRSPLSIGRPPQRPKATHSTSETRISILRTAYH